MTLRVLLMPVGSAGDVHPFVGLGVELKRRGHDVTLATNGHFRTPAERMGLTFVEQGTEDDFRSAIENPHLWKGDARAARVVFGMSTRLQQEQYELCLGGNWSAVVAGPLAFGARSAQDKRDLPLATVQLAPVFLSAEKPPRFPSVYMPPWFPTWLNGAIFRAADAMVDWFAAGAINTFRREHGLPQAKRIAGQWMYSPRCVLTMFPEWYASPARDWPANVMQTGFPLYDERGASAMSPAVRDFIAAGEPPIAFTGGSANTQAKTFFAASVAACERLGRRALLVSRYPEQLPPLSARVMHVDYAPFSELLPGLAAFVHHGGIGTTAQALAAGVPQLVTPLAHDQFENALRVRLLGCGDELRGTRYTADRAATKLAGLLNDASLRQRCAATAARIDRDAGLRASADVVEKLAKPTMG